MFARLRSWSEWAPYGASAAIVVASLELAWLRRHFPAIDQSVVHVLGAFILLLGIGACMGLFATAICATGERLWRALPPRAFVATAVGSAAAISGAVVSETFGAWLVKGLVQFPEYNTAIRATFTGLLWSGLALLARGAFEPGLVKASARWPVLTRTAIGAYYFGLGVAALHVGEAVFARLHARGFAGAAAFAAVLLFTLAGRVVLPSLKHAKPGHGALALSVLACGVFVPVSSLSVYAVHSRAHAIAGLLRTVRWALDFDRDRTAPWWAQGTDCAPFSSSISPAAREIPGDSIDQDCSGADAPVSEPDAVRDNWPTECPIPERPDVVLVTIDTLQPNKISAKGAPFLYAAKMNALAFERAYAPATLTRHSLPALFAGAWPSDLSEGTLLTHRDLRVVRSIAQRLAAEGYDSIAMHTLEPEIPDLGFLEVHPSSVIWPSAGQFNEAAASRDVTRAAESLLTSTRSKPTFLWIHYLQPHAPYESHILRYDQLSSDYEREIADVDIQVGHVLRAINKSERASQTIVIVTADHGESLGEAGHEGHGPDAIEAVMRVPLFMVIPGCRARSIDAPVSIVTLAATIERMITGHTTSATLFDPSQIVLVEAAARGLKRTVIAGDHKLVIDVPTGSRWLARTDDESMAPKNAAERLTELNALYQRWLDRPLLSAPPP